jgi:hypothetical protein
MRMDERRVGGDVGMVGAMAVRWSIDGKIDCRR